MGVGGLKVDTTGHSRLEWPVVLGFVGCKEFRLDDRRR